MQSYVHTNKGTILERSFHLPQDSYSRTLFFAKGKSYKCWKTADLLKIRPNINDCCLLNPGHITQLPLLQMISTPLHQLSGSCSLGSWLGIDYTLVNEWTVQQYFLSWVIHPSHAFEVILEPKTGTPG